MKTLPNAIRDIGFAISYLNGESMKSISERADIGANRIALIIRNTVYRARTAVRISHDIHDPDGLLMSVPSELRANRAFVIKILRLHEQEIQKEQAEVSLDDPLIRLHLPAKTQLVLHRCFSTVGDVIAHLNNNGGDLNITGLSITAKPAVTLRLEKLGLSKHLKYRHQNYISVPDIFEEMLQYMTEPESFNAEDKARLQKTIETKLISYKRYRPK